MTYPPVFPATSFRDVYSVSRLNREVKLLLEGGFPLLWIEGEISGLAAPSSGHLYFCLKDAHAQIRCALFRGQLRGLAAIPKNGMQVLVRGRVGLYEGRGEFQLIIEHLEDAGEGALRRAFEALKNRLAKEGLFDAARKKPIPQLPKRIGVITSLSGAVWHDIRTTLKRRFPAIPLLLYPVPVQGDGAAEKIADAIRLAGARAECDVLILARGGGSLEDLWAFNEEIVARALFTCPIPVVCGVGHETDFTIADWVADARAPTPTAAAELLSPDQDEWRRRFSAAETRLARLMREHLRNRAQQLDGLAARVLHPRHRLQLLAQRLGATLQRLNRAQAATRAHARAELLALRARLHQSSPLPAVHKAQWGCERLFERLTHAVNRKLERAGHSVAQRANALHSLSPLATLARGYAIVSTSSNGLIVNDASTVKLGERIEARLARGALTCVVEERREK